VRPDVAPAGRRDARPWTASSAARELRAACGPFVPGVWLGREHVRPRPPGLPPAARWPAGAQRLRGQRDTPGPASWADARSAGSPAVRAAGWSIPSLAAEDNSPSPGTSRSPREGPRFARTRPDGGERWARDIAAGAANLPRDGAQKNHCRPAIGQAREKDRRPSPAAEGRPPGQRQRAALGSWRPPERFAHGGEKPAQ